jgi:hypothetical protein
MAKSSEADRIAALERRIGLLEAYVDSAHREQLGLTLDDIRAIWRGTRTREPAQSASVPDTYFKGERLERRGD